MKEFELVNSRGIRVSVLDFGGIITKLIVPDREGRPGDVVLGFDDYSKYRDKSPYFGAIIGRYANRIAGGKFRLKNRVYQLDINQGSNHLHGGVQGFDKVIWEVEKYKMSSSSSLKLSYQSPDGDQGYPGNLDCAVVYSLNEANELKIEYQAFTDKTTVVALTHHSYFNLNNAGNRDIRDHEMEIHASNFTPVDENLIPTGEIKAVTDSGLDFTRPKSIGEGLDSLGSGFDHNYVLDKAPGQLELVARVSAPQTGRIMEVLTTEPGMQFYTPSSMDIFGKNRQLYGDWSSFCLETQHFPDSPNKPDFPSVVLEPGEMYKSTTIYRFKTG